MSMHGPPPLCSLDERSAWRSARCGAASSARHGRCRPARPTRSRLQRLRIALEAEVLRRHQQLAGSVTGCDHLAHIGRASAQAVSRRSHACRHPALQSPAAYGYMFGVQMSTMSMSGSSKNACTSVVRRWTFQFLPQASSEALIDIAAGHDFGVFGCVPAGHVRARNAARADHCHLKVLAHDLLLIDFGLLSW